MTLQWTDKAGAPVAISVERSGSAGAYVVALADGSVAGRAEFVGGPAGVDAERIFFHTEVDPRFGGRGLGKVLVREALLDSIRVGVGVVPVCPLFAAHLKAHGVEFLADGGTFRRPTPDDLALVSRHVHRGS
ncbi:N-acetyltransferase [Microbacterium sp. NPDC089695]|uniref:N-acetyltransferase n=1 Tax=Microbacterium sp. NPDC089695 TaxID=3364198 RepID=UPI00383043FC